MKLSTNFDSAEFDCKHCFQGGDAMHPNLIKLLEKLRADCGGFPLYINSGYRCNIHNANVGGVPNSQHVLKTAADVSPPQNMSVEEFCWYCDHCSIDGLKFDGVGYYSADNGNFVHVDVRYGGYGPRVEW